MDTSDTSRNIAGVFEGSAQSAVARAELLESIRAIPSTLAQSERLLVALTVSTLTGTRSDVEHLRSELDASGTPTSLVDSIERVAGRWPVCDDDRLAVIVDYAAQLTRSPAAVTPQDLQRLRAVALTDLDIVVLNNIAGAYNDVNAPRADSSE